MHISESGSSLTVTHGIDTDNNRSGVWIVHSDRDYNNCFSTPTTRIIAEREASLLSMLIQGRKLKQFAGGELSGLFEPES